MNHFTQVILFTDTDGRARFRELYVDLRSAFARAARGAPE